MGGDGEENPNVLSLTVRSGGEEVVFKVKKDTKMSKIFSAYASQKGIDPATMRFTFDGKRLAADETPKMLEMEDGDQIDVHIEQLGGFA